MSIYGYMYITANNKIRGHEYAKDQERVFRMIGVRKGRNK